MLTTEKTIASYWRRVFAEKNNSAIEKKRREKDREKKKRNYSDIQMSAYDAVKICRG